MRGSARLPLVSGACLASLTLLAACGGSAEPGTPAAGTPPESSPAASSSTPTPSSSFAVVGTQAEGLTAPWSVAPLPDGSALVTERDTARLLLVSAGGDDVEEVATVEEAVPDGEGGLLGVAVSSSFADDGLVHLYVTAQDDNRILRGHLDGDTLGELEVVLEGIPKAGIHNGGRMSFGPDGLLYVGTGDAAQPELAPDPGSLAGKILRLTPDGEVPTDNPDPTSPVWSSGHRNVQGLAFDDAGRLWASEFGANEADELNLIEAGGDYGWPAVEGLGGPDADPELTDPVLTWDPGEASPSGLGFLDGSLYLASLRGERVWSIPVDEDGAGEPTAQVVGEYGRLRDAVAGPDGRLWVLTHNRDGKGDPAENDDRILLIEP